MTITHAIRVSEFMKRLVLQGRSHVMKKIPYFTNHIFQKINIFKSMFSRIFFHMWRWHLSKVEVPERNWWSQQQNILWWWCDSRKFLCEIVLNLINNGWLLNTSLFYNLRYIKLHNIFLNIEHNVSLPNYIFPIFQISLG